MKCCYQLSNGSFCSRNAEYDYGVPPHHDSYCFQHIKIVEHNQYCKNVLEDQKREQQEKLKKLIEDSEVNNLLHDVNELEFIIKHGGIRMILKEYKQMLVHNFQEL